MSTERGNDDAKVDTRIFAFQAGITRLYHYEPFVPEYLATTLNEYKVHCSHPARLNDPWDCCPSFDKSGLNDPGVRELSVKWLQALEPKNPIDPRQDAYMAMQMYNIPSFAGQTIDLISQSFPSVIAERWRIYCLTPHPDSTLMWSHYADNHKGICLEFAADNNARFAQAWQVIYRGAYPVWAVHSLEHHIDILLTKSDDWLYENEYRIIGRTGKDLAAENVGLPMLVGDFLPLPDGSLLSVIVGCGADAAAISEVVKKHMPGLPIKYAVREPNRYRLYIDTRPAPPLRDMRIWKPYEFRWK